MSNVIGSSGSDGLVLGRAPVLTLTIGLIVSALVHLGVGVGVSEYARSVEIEHDPSDGMRFEQSMIEVEDRSEIELGIDEAQVASIHWLGVREDAEIGDAPESEVEQAALTTRVGDVEESVASVEQERVEEVQAVQEPVDESVEETVEETVEEPSGIEEPVNEPVEVEPVVVEPDEVEPVVDVEPAVEVELREEALVEKSELVEVETEQIESSNPVEEIKEELIEEEPEKQVPESAVDVSETEVVVAREAQEESSVSAESVKGKEGEVSEKETSASILKRALDVSPKSFHKPIAGKGIELIPVEPKFPASVRFTQLPRNPVVMLRFNHKGVVVKAWFLKEGKRIWDTGSIVVDEPLLNAMYKWRAKGDEIEKLGSSSKGNAEKRYLEIPMRIVFRKEARVP